MNMFYVLDSMCQANQMKRIFSLIGNIYTIIQIAVPIILVLWGTIDLVKAIVSNNDENVKKSQSMFIKRLIYGVVIFFVLPLIKFLMGLIGQNMDSPCMDCFLDPNNKSVCNFEYKEVVPSTENNGKNNIKINIEGSGKEEKLSESTER